MSNSEVYLVNPSYEDNPMSSGQAYALQQAFKAKGTRVPAKIRAKARHYKSGRKNPSRKWAQNRRRTSKWSSLVKKHGVQKAAKMYRKNPKKGKSRKRSMAAKKGWKARKRTNPWKI